MSDTVDTDAIRDEINVAEMWQMRGWIDALCDALDATRTERDDLVEERDLIVEAVCDALIEVGPWDEIDGDGTEASILPEHIATLGRNMDELVEALHRYGLHQLGCERTSPVQPPAWQRLACTCGLAALLARYPRPERDGGDDE